LETYAAEHETILRLVAEERLLELRRAELLAVLAGGQNAAARRR
jgi:hypothetical protein